MAKDLPYFKFFVSEWNDGDITLEDMETQGLFINLCSYYWSQECDVTLTKVKKRFKHNTKLVDVLIESSIISINGDDISIKFLDEQKGERKVKSLTNSSNGKLGGRPKKQTETQNKPNALISLSETEAKQKAIREEKRRKEKKREEVLADFKVLLTPYLDLYGKDMLNEFFSYWTEYGENDFKVRYQKEKSFSVERRLSTWSNRNKSFAPKQNGGRL